jgi:hypothetical protein
MLTIASTFITSFSKDYLQVNWTIEPTVEDVNLYSFSLLRSNSPSGPFMTVKEGITGQFGFKDTTVNLISDWRKYYYKVKTVEIADTNNFVESEAFTQGYEPDTVALEIIRRNNLILGNDFTGRPVFVFIKRTFGQRCGECWDYITKRRCKSGCLTCFDTGFVNGYFTPMIRQMNINPEHEKVQMQKFKIEPNQTAGWLSNEPALSPGDLIVEGLNQRWRVIDVRKTEKRRTLLHQTVRLTSVNNSDIEYKLHIPDSETL